ncbi:MAG: DUF4115 domain-containing protein [Acidimicrobiales bacterium]
MTLAIAAGVAALVVIAVGVGVGLARRGGETHSVDDYRHTLETLQGLSEHPKVRVLKPGEADEPAPADTARQPAGLRFEDLGPTDDAAVSTRSAQRSRRSQSRALSSMNHRPRRLAGTIASAVVVLAVLGVVVAVGTTRHPGAPPPTTTTPRRNTTTPRRNTTTTTTTTVPPKFTPVTSTTTTATYTAPSASFSITLATTTGNCWVNVTSSTGTTLLSQTLPAGTTKTIAASGTTTVILGAPSAIDVSIDHQPVVLPTGFQTPFTMTLQPAAGT